MSKAAVVDLEKKLALAQKEAAESRLNASYLRGYANYLRAFVVGQARPLEFALWLDKNCKKSYGLDSETKGRPIEAFSRHQRGTHVGQHNRALHNGPGLK